MGWLRVIGPSLAEEEGIECALRETPEPPGLIRATNANDRLSTSPLKHGHFSNMNTRILKRHKTTCKLSINTACGFSALSLFALSFDVGWLFTERELRHRRGRR